MALRRVNPKDGGVAKVFGTLKSIRTKRRDDKRDSFMNSQWVIRQGDRGDSSPHGPAIDFNQLEKKYRKLHLLSCRTACACLWFRGFGPAAPQFRDVNRLSVSVFFSQQLRSSGDLVRSRTQINRRDVLLNQTVERNQVAGTNFPPLGNQWRGLLA